MERNRLGSTRDIDARARTARKVLSCEQEASIETVIAFLERPKPARCCCGAKKQQVSDLDGQILELVRADSELKALDTLLQSVPGVGRVVAATLLSSLPELGFAASSRLRALVGVAPMNHDSDHARQVHLMVKKWLAPWASFYSWWSWRCASSVVHGGTIGCSV